MSKKKETLISGIATFAMLGSFALLLPLKQVFSENIDVDKPAENLFSIPKIQIANHKLQKASSQSANTKNKPKAEGDLVLVNKTHPAEDDPNLKLVNITNNEQVAERVKQPYEEMAKAASEAGHPLVVVSAHRSKQYQDTIYHQQIELYQNQGYSLEEATKKTDDYMMKPGTSEHQTGLAIDVLDEAEYQIRPELSPEFGQTDGGKWLADNAYKYGFVIRYPKDKEEITKIKYEPWHLRYVGKENAKKMHDQKICLEEYVNTENN